ncbi:MAG: epoxyqueuosine reductase QueH [Lachnospiraceae bacterium]|jgi:predicted adenine nucleotide alpha hydrolase (AANH) superfamily ATPase|nr:epoxyqueuosine reductase QueH [Lachnospiraceae bacterium]NLC75827.1 epoxyqueuosine reductase QueH [Clostridiales bacterium]
MNNINYSRETEKIIDRNRETGEVPTLLLHACCAPCSSYCLEYLREYFMITVFYYNPNITDAAEYEKRKAEEKRLIAEYNSQVDEGKHIDIMEAPYDPESFLAMAKGLEDAPEGGERCMACYALRLGKTAETAYKCGFEYFTTTLTISPLKSAAKLNEAGETAEEHVLTEHPESHLKFLPSDFKKKGGFQRSIELSHKYGLYRQNYCGCEFSKRGTELHAEIT